MNEPSAEAGSRVLEWERCHEAHERVTKEEHWGRRGVLAVLTLGA